MNYITQDEFAARYPATNLSQFSASTISGMISEASQYVDNFCQVDGFDLRTVIAEKVEATITNTGDFLFYPRRTPVSAVYSINLSRGSFSLDLTTVSGTGSLVQIPTRGTSFRYPSTFQTSVGTFTINDLAALRGENLLATVNYLGGYETIPGPIKVATMLVLRDMVNRATLNVAGASSVTQGGITIKYSEKKDGNNDGKSDDIRDAEVMLQDYVRRVLV